MLICMQIGTNICARPTGLQGSPLRQHPIFFGPKGPLYQRLILLISIVPPIPFMEVHKQLDHIGFDNLEHMWTSTNSGGLSIAPRGDSFCDSFLEANMKCSLFHLHESCLATKLNRTHTNLAGFLPIFVE